MTSTDSDGRAHDVLAWAAATCDPEIRSWMSALGPLSGKIAAYQLGWSEGLPSRGHHRGKSVRTALALLSARAVGGEVAAAIPAATAVEMVHNLSLLYDDVLDGDTVRRHRAAAWQVFGPASATRAADALLMLAFETLSAPEGDVRIAQEASAALLDTSIQLAVGESLDVLFERRDRVEVEECLEMISGKTASLFSCACRLGALYGEANEADIDRFAAFGHDLGMAFQLVDDLLGIWGDSGVTGKPVFADLRARKMSTPVVAALASGTTAAKELARRYARPPGTDPDREGALLAELVEEAGGRRWARRCAAEHAEAAEGWLRELGERPGAGPGTLADLRAVCALIVTRSH
ncbi:polyprenyl synthetase family protein [Streptomyces iconiensis]|uniref:Polyprenyl synthetase family protein n=1 Tax=Streptomyces iconiensis TaxID=1384038 RepID=A0ABT7A9P6_9ACTN|nr:polyprenyl synthetase family protein [Streptomyces iconiensis]MDJ1138065.1 polyprenyl synthetase family protein [Streptomyces iconiensis]